MDPLNSMNKADIRARTWGLIGYALQGFGIVVGVSLLLSIVLNYLMKNKINKTLGESHFRWQRHTFWWTLAFLVVGILTAYINIGYLFIFVGSLILAARTFWGAIKLYKCQPV
ncbi:DUF4870 family protein [Microbulbifer epialgicus]|uniref:DUF4870 family protein n=1 Tax=Microbulbifer epialgicus TaxID=393907 RepID=A0ABV4NUM3_9GAMM